jgi:hypothetical protein
MLGLFLLSSTLDVPSILESLNKSIRNALGLLETNDLKGKNRRAVQARGAEPMQKFFVGFVCEDPKSGVKGFGYTFAKKKGEVRVRAKNKMDTGSIGRNLNQIWICEIADPDSRLQLWNGPAKGTEIPPETIAVLLQNARKTYKVGEGKKAKTKPHIRLPSGPPVVTTAAPAKPATVIYRPYDRECADNYQQPKEVKS